MPLQLVYLVSHCDDDGILKLCVHLTDFMDMKNEISVLITKYLHFRSKPLMNLKNFANVHSLMKDT